MTLIPGQGTKVKLASRCGLKKERERKRDACPRIFHSGSQAGLSSHPLCFLCSLGHIFTSHTHQMVVFCLLVCLDLPPQTVSI